MPIRRIFRELHGFSGAERALLLTLALAAILVVAMLLRGGSERAAGDARRVLAQGGAPGPLQQPGAIAAPRALQQPGKVSTGRALELARLALGRPGLSSLGALRAAFPAEPPILPPGLAEGGGPLDWLKRLLDKGVEWLKGKLKALPDKLLDKLEEALKQEIEDLLKGPCDPGTLARLTTDVAALEAVRSVKFARSIQEDERKWQELQKSALEDCSPPPPWRAIECARKLKEGWDLGQDVARSSADFAKGTAEAEGYLGQMALRCGEGAVATALAEVPSLIKALLDLLETVLKILLIVAIAIVVIVAIVILVQLVLDALAALLAALGIAVLV